MLYFSETVWVLTFSSSLSALDPLLDGLRESANGLSNPLLSRLRSDSQLDRFDANADMSDDFEGDSSSRILVLWGANNVSEESGTLTSEYIWFGVRLDLCGALVGLEGMRDRDDPCPE